MKLGIYGTGGSGRELYEMITETDALCAQWDEIVFIDDTTECGVFRNRKMMPFKEFEIIYSPAEIKVSIAVGEPAARAALAEKVKNAGYMLATCIHPDAEISPSARIGEGAVIKKGAIVSSDAILEDNVWLQSYAIIGHDARIGCNCQISTYAVVAGRTVVGQNVYIGLSACLREKIVIGDNAILSMGAIVQRDVRSNMIAMGNPAREIAENKNGVFS